MSVVQQLEEEQLRYHKLLIDFQEVPMSLRNSIEGTPLRTETMRKVVRYAHERLANAHRDVEEIEEGLARRGIFGEDRGYGRKVEEGIQRAQHRDDETWIQKATIAELTEEAELAAHERKHVEYSANNLRPQLRDHDAIERIKAAGRVHLYEGPGSRASERLGSPNTNSSPSSDDGRRGGNRFRSRGGGGGRSRDHAGRYLTNVNGPHANSGSWRGS